MIILRSDELADLDLGRAMLVDDTLVNITHVIRGERP